MRLYIDPVLPDVTSYMTVPTVATSASMASATLREDVRDSK